MTEPRKAAAKRRRLAKTITNRIIEELFVNRLGDRAERLQLRDKNERDLGGYCRHAATGRVLEIVNEALKERDLV